MISQHSKNGYKNVANANMVRGFYHSKILTTTRFVPCGIAWASLSHIGFTRELCFLDTKCFLAEVGALLNARMEIAHKF